SWPYWIGGCGYNSMGHVVDVTFRTAEEMGAGGRISPKPVDTYLVTMDLNQGQQRVFEIVAPKLEGRPGPTKLSPYRMEFRYDDEARQALQELAEDSGETQSDVLRRLIAEAKKD